MASDLSWRTEDIVRAYTLGRLIEVFFDDWKVYEDWDTLRLKVPRSSRPSKLKASTVPPSAAQGAVA